ncbi:RNA-directed RNA polymerase [ssRNA phage Zoerhiza.2_21]|uniref:RNA-directed RNA polymerase n=2 Tax=Leviviricetes TaxID=2842243 RepID=A0A8S5L1L5_9VIRU|nr:RNA-directed RNA polymerase [ssRNA phage Zoerhiza.2_21]QDH89685.1 MAG: RNA-dependent RNA polymerase [Leviviridae sp.]DAD51758.1 TPA_asm: RNA-directed RNA polymerase [ssRNA phage Zoerhiza.2_21]
MKSNLSDQIAFMHCIYIDACMKCSADVSDLRDLKTIQSRVEKEGLSFLTITLPQFSSDFERSLEVGYVDSSCFRNFRKHGSIPAFLQGMVSLIFDRETGRIIDELSTSVDSREIPVLIESIRQICLTFKKVRVDCSPERTTAALEKFAEIEHSFDTFSLQEQDLEYFIQVSRVLWSTLVSHFDLAKVRPRHGPGATAEKISGNQKFNHQLWFDRLEPYFPILGNAYPLGTPPESSELEKLTVLNQEQEIPVRVTPVPKTLKGPRIIAIEPCCMQFTQQGIKDWLYASLESYRLTRGHVNFRDQSINQQLAISSSKDNRFVTIDLSDASDRVPLSLVTVMLDRNPILLDSILACRSNSAVLPDGREIRPLKKFASMGSALCFPIEAMYFYTICVMASLRSQNLPVSLENVFKVSRDIFVYGDDIVVPKTDADVVLDYLQKYNCKVNARKTFVNGSFRESCGVDAFAGYEVTPTYLREMHPKDKREADKLISWTKTANLFYKKGYWRTCSFMVKAIERLVGPLPYVSEESGCLGRISFLGFRSVERWNRGLQRFEVKALVPRPVYRTGILEGYAALACSLSLLEASAKEALDLDRDVHVLERYALHGAVTLTRRWVPAT